MGAGPLLYLLFCLPWGGLGSLKTECVLSRKGALPQCRDGCIHRQDEVSPPRSRARMLRMLRRFDKVGLGFRVRGGSYRALEN